MNSFLTVVVVGYVFIQLLYLLFSHSLFMIENIGIWLIAWAHGRYEGQREERLRRQETFLVLQRRRKIIRDNRSAAIEPLQLVTNDSEAV